MGRSFLGKNGGFGGICPKGPVEHVLEWGYTCNLSRWLLSALLEPQSSSQLTKFKLSPQLKIWFPKNSWILACKPSDKTSLGLHAKIYDFFGEWKKMQTQQQPYPGTADATIKIMHPSLGLAQPYPGTADATIKISICHLDLHDRTRVRSCKSKWQMQMMQTQQSKF